MKTSVNEKSCKKCGEISTNFSSGRNICKKCNNKLIADWRKNNPDRAKEIAKKCRDERKDINKANSKKYRDTHKEEIKEYEKSRVRLGVKMMDRKLYKVISNEDINLLADIITIAKYLSWQNEIGDLSAHGMMDKIHKGKYGSGNGVWVQARDMFNRIGAYSELEEDTDIMLDQRYR